MKIELKNIKVSEHMSEETTAFTADIFINGKKAGYCKNGGYGGPTDYHALGGNTVSLMNEAEEYCKSLPKLKFGDGFEINMNLEVYIGDLLEKHLMYRNIKRDMAKGLCIKTNNGYEIVSWKNFNIAKLLAHPTGKDVLERKIKELKAVGKEILNTNLTKDLMELL
jgi:hypothetical protein